MNLRTHIALMAILPFILSRTSVVHANGNAGKNIQIIKSKWELKLQPDEIVLASEQRGTEIVDLKTKKYDVMLLASDAPPESIVTVKNRIAELKGDPKTLMIHPGKTKRSTTFSFVSGKDIHWYSVQGGHLVGMSKDMTPELKKRLLAGIRGV